MLVETVNSEHWHQYKTTYSTVTIQHTVQSQYNILTSTVTKNSYTYTRVSHKGAQDFLEGMFLNPHTAARAFSGLTDSVWFHRCPLQHA